MRTEKVQSPNFKAVVYKPNSKEYVKTFLTARDKEVFSAVTEKFSTFKNWDLEICDKGMRVASKTNPDAFLIEEMFINEPEGSKIKATAIYDGKKYGLNPGDKCKFFLEYATRSAAWKTYEEIATLPYAERAVALTDILEKKQEETNKEVEFTRAGIVGKIFDILSKY